MILELETPEKYVLGLDLGSASLGWALIGLNSTGDPERLIRAGVRIFEPGVDGSSLEIEQGKDQSKAVERRAARLQRRQLRRRVARQRELFLELQRVGLLPTSATGKGAGSEQRHQILNAFDQALTAKYLSSNGETFAQGPLYFLRKRALDHALEAHELGRILFHLSQRRGFKSNRKETKRAKDNEDPGQVNEQIHSLRQQMETVGARTLGAYFAGLDPHTEQVRRRWTARDMFEHEFAEIWKAQRPNHEAILTRQFHDRIHHLLFYQRPIAAQKKLIGPCELEPGEKRAPWSSLAAQRFRLLQKVTDTKVLNPAAAKDDPLTTEQTRILYTLLEEEGDQTFKSIKKALGLEGRTLNHERGKRMGLLGNATAKSMRRIFGDRWQSFSEKEQEEIVSSWSDAESNESLAQKACEVWKLDEYAIQRLLSEVPAKDYCSLSLKAIARLVPLMLGGLRFKEAEKQLYFDSGSKKTPKLAKLPPVKRAIPTLRNPAVERALTELRKVVNAIVRKHGLPYEIRIELARELKKPRQERFDATLANAKREKANKLVAQKIAREYNIDDPNYKPSRGDLEKAKLHVECGGICPYTGKCIPFSSLFHDSEFDVEHIIPRSRYPDDSFQNKTLCYIPENREYKKNLTPYEAYAERDPELWAQILHRVSKWSNTGKLRRFKIQTTEELGDFTARQLNDTRYASVLAGRLLSYLYGGDRVREGDKNRLVIFASSGAVTATLRRNWGFEHILRGFVASEPGEAYGKPRTDHRHHAVDAITIALTRQSIIQSMANAAQVEPWLLGARAWRTVPKPWTTPEFEHQMSRQIQEMIVSHRPSHKISGELHKGTNYGKPYTFEGKSMIHSRRALSVLSVADIEEIIDPAVQDAVRAKLQEIGGNPKLFDKEGNTPYLISGSGKKIPIKKVRSAPDGMDSWGHSLPGHGLAVVYRGTAPQSDLSQRIFHRTQS